MRCASLAAVLLLLSVPAALAQKGDWQVVKNIPPGAAISVKYRGLFIHVRCIFQSATDDRLVCARILRGRSVVLIPAEVSYERAKIQEVRLEHSDTSNMALGAAIGAAVGGALGAARSGDTHANARIVLGLVVGTGGALIGAMLGRDFPIRQGKVIYRR
jgi:hypothetical protein